MSAPIVFLSDYGLDDEFVGVCHGVIARVSPGTSVIDLSHSVPPYDVARGAILLRDSLPFVPNDGIFLAVVDPGVGTSRRPIAVRAGVTRMLVGPDNGLLSLACEALGGSTEAVVISSPDVVLARTSDTFQGRDVFAPAAAHLSSGKRLEELGPAIDDLASLVHVTIPDPEVSAGRIESVVLAIDRYGNIGLNIQSDDLARSGISSSPDASLEVGGRSLPLKFVRTFAEAGEREYAAVVDSSGRVAIVLNRDSAARHLTVGVGDVVVLRAG